MADERDLATFRQRLERCLEYPGTSYATIGAIFGVGQTTVGGWMRDGNTPKRPSLARAIRMLEQYEAQCQEQSDDPRWCDTHWRDHLAAYLRTHTLTPEVFAVQEQIDGRFGRRWACYGEVPNDRYRTVMAERTGYDFEGAYIPRAVAAAQRLLGDALPAPLDVVRDDATLHDAVMTIRNRWGMTTRQLAERADVPVTQVHAFSRTEKAQRSSYTVASIASFLAGLARFVRATPAVAASSGADGIAVALALLRERPPPPKHTQPLQYTSVRWDRIAERLAVQHDRYLSYRCTDGEPVPVMYIRFCIAYEQAALTTTEAAHMTRLSPHTIGRWCNGRSIPDPAMFERIQAATHALDAFRTGTAAPPSPPAEAPPAPPLHRAAGAVATAPRPPPDDVMHDTGLAFATLGDALAKAHAAGWRPSERTRAQLVGAARHVVAIAEITAEDLVRKDAVMLPGQAPGLTAILDELNPVGQPHRGAQPRSQQGGTKR